MKAVLCKAFGPPESLVMEDVPAPEPRAGEVLVDVHACGLNFPDVLMIQGKYQSQPPFPFAPGGEIAGTVAALGEGVEGYAVGDRVFAGIGFGGFAEQVVVKARALKPVPDTMTLQQASGISTTYGTSYYALKQRADLKAGETLLVLGAAGGVGLAAVELGKAMGARVIAAASTAEKLEVARKAGADEVIDYSDGELKEKVKALTDGKGADVIYDPVGGELFDQCMRCVNWYGRVLVIGFAAGDIPKVPINLILLKSCQVVGVFYGAWSARCPDEAADNFREILELQQQGRIDPLVGAEYPLAEYAEALRCLMERRAIGKVVVNVR
ncbi:MAG: NADPH:quinone oxidoreductase [Gammaproteobacteria bacterium]|nr:NADPH:quinone oxidoreductase [Gammaproteobacteria bacterium]MBK82126.1 NADPH:quinone oxidoreductase [Gammaproteobacteria bacterium]|tara:strand:- start:5031 stop:6008 length:978 start_codon:yes stop_codon:yes gene_type:complete